MKTDMKVLLGLGVLAGIGALGFWWYESTKPFVGTASTSGNTTTITVGDGAQTVTVPPTTTTVIFQLPSGGTWVSTTATTASGFPAGTATPFAVEGVNNTPGASDAISFVWNSSNGAQHSTTISVAVAGTAPSTTPATPAPAATGG